MLSPASAGATIIPFPALQPHRNRLTPRDRLQIETWSGTAGAFGYRLAVGECLPQDYPHIGNYLAICRHGEPWATWGVARHGSRLRVWRCATNADFGDFSTIEEALRAILTAPAPPDPRFRREPS